MHQLISAAAALAATAAPAQAEPVKEPVTVEYYYRIKWGSGDEFKRLYKANHEPILQELQRQGRILALRTDEPFTHMAGGQRWDMRVTITFPDAASATVAGGDFDKASQEITKRLYPDKDKFFAEEAKRFGLLEEHWDVIVTRSGED